MKGGEVRLRAAREGDPLPIHRTVQIIVSSVSDGRLCPVIAEWVAGVGRETAGLDFARLDLRDWHLPTDDERNGPTKAEPTRRRTPAPERHHRRHKRLRVRHAARQSGDPASLNTAIGRFGVDRPDRRRTPMTFAKLDSGCGSP